MFKKIMYLPSCYLNCIFKYILLFATAWYVVQARHAKKQINEQKHHVKWVFDDYLFPIVLTKNIYNPVDADFKVSLINVIIRTNFEYRILLFKTSI